ncbi:hypothetical protein [Poriferisphaera sp. WC338]|uniref:hypothetical protein n=1 Tax=Poriferisphaera sp. WC338 TaxID=3425129 RepID=UPI003D8188B4
MKCLIFMKIIVCLMMCTLLLEGGVSRGEDTAETSLDEMLGIDMKETLTEKEAVIEVKTNKQSVSEVNHDEAKQAVRRMLAEEDPADLFEKIVHGMKQVSERLGREYETGLPTQRQQKVILDQLDQVIAQSSQGKGGKGGSADEGGQQLKGEQGKKQAGQQGGQRGNGAQLSQGTGENNGQAGVSKAIQNANQREDIQEHRVEWGRLPQRVRDELREGLNEPFSGLYRKMTEAYYRRLAEEQTGQSE